MTEDGELYRSPTPREKVAVEHHGVKSRYIFAHLKVDCDWRVGKIGIFGAFFNKEKHIM
jgi:hypothetical protein